MSTPVYHLAEINVARLIAPLDDPRLADFVAQLDAVNAAADRAAGFIWRLSATDAAAYGQVPGDPLLLVNLSLWASVEALRDFTYRGRSHGPVFRDRSRWFQTLDTPPLAMWWVPAGTIPTLTDGLARLQLLARYGAGKEAFTFKQLFPNPGFPAPEDEGQGPV